jgi:flagellar hook-associated protein 1 FlgK
MSGFNLLNIGSQAVLANRTALTTVSQNIANASTEGYSRQSANFVSVNDLQGTYIQDIDRATDQFITRQLWSDLASHSSLNFTDSLISQTDNLLASSSTSISTALDTYFKSMQNAVDDPTSLANRELYVEQTSSLAQRFNTMHANLMTQNDSVNATMKAGAENLSQYTKSVGVLNDQIANLVAKGDPVNELRDQRDVLVNKIAGIVNVNVVEQGEKYNLFIGNGQPLIVGETVNDVELRQGDPDNTQPQVYIKMSGSEINVTQDVSGGVLGGAKDFRNNVLNPSLNELGRIALALQDETNTQHRKGMDLDNKLGGDVFTPINDKSYMPNRLKASSTNLSTLNTAFVEIKDVSKLTVNDYELIVNDDDKLIIKRQPTGELMNLTKVTTAPVNTNALADNSYYIDSSTGIINAKFEGIDITLQANSYLAIGDKFLVQPTRTAGEQIAGVLSDAKQVALASPVRVATNPNNTGTAVVTTQVTDPNNATFLNSSTTGNLTPPLEVVFNNDNPIEYSVFDVTNPLDPQPITVNAVVQQDLAFTAGQTISVNGFDIKFEGIPSAGDRFGFNYNQDGVSDNRNALALSNIQTKKILSDGSMQDHYSGLVENVGARAASGKINLTASESVLKSTKDTLASVVGVNLDEEAARLVQFQQAYQASARVITTSQVLFDTLLQSF